MKKIIAFSGSPIHNSNTDRLIKHLLENSGIEYEFIKLSSKHIGPCRACKGCASDNICKVKDDFQAIAEKIKEADAIIIGAYTPYSLLDGFTKSLLERFFSFRHQKSLLKDKFILSVVASVYDEVRNKTQESIVLESIAEKMRYVASLGICGSNPCYSCGKGNDCENSIKNRLGQDAEIDLDGISQVEQQAVWKEAAQVGGLLGRLINGEEDYQAPAIVEQIMEKLKNRYTAKAKQNAL